VYQLFFLCLHLLFFSCSLVHLCCVSLADIIIMSISGVSSTGERRNLAVVYKGPKDVEIKDIGYPEFKDPQGNPAQHAVIVKPIATNICGSDLHMYRGRTDYPPGMAFGHEITGEVVELGSLVSNIQVGDWVSIPFNISCGTCRNCKERKTSLCHSVNVEQPGGAYGFADMGGWQGGQAEYVLVPYADWNCLVLPKDQVKGKMLEIAMLSDILPTGFNAAVQAGVGVGKTVYIAGAGPVGICCAASCLLLGASLVVVGDVNASRLPNVQKLGPNIRTLDLTQVSKKANELNKALIPLIGGEEVDCSVDCVGWEATAHGGKHGLLGGSVEESEMVLNACFSITRSGGALGIPGVYVPIDPKGTDTQHKAGYLPLSFGTCWQKGISIQMGQCPVMAYHRELMLSIIHNRIKVVEALNVKIISLEEAPAAYKSFNNGEPCKYVLDPHNYLRSGTA